jgi:hypothetical protein
MFAIFFGFMTVVAMFLGAYIALVLVRDDYDFSLRNFSEQAGQAIAVWYKQAVEKFKGVGNLVNMVKGGIGANLQKTAASTATNLVNTAANTATTTAANAVNTAANTATTAATNQVAAATGAVTNKLAAAVAAPTIKGKSLFKLKR